jgi:hypothetical protein
VGGKVRELAATPESPNSTVSFDEIAANPAVHGNASRAGLTPSAADIEAAGPGGRQTLHTRYISVGGGRIANPGPGVEGPQVTVEITEIRQLNRNDWAYAMREDSRDPFPGPPVIDRLLDRMLLPDPAQRISIDEIVHELRALAR